MARKFNAKSKAKTRTWIIVTPSNDLETAFGTNIKYRDRARKKGKPKEGTRQGNALEFQFNPENISYGRSAKYSSIESPGMPYPLTQFVNGQANEFSFQAFFYDKPYTGKVHDAKEFIKTKLMPPQSAKKGFRSPPVFTFAYGRYAKRCVLLSYHVDSEERDKDGKPVMAYITFTMRQVGTVNRED